MNKLIIISFAFAFAVAVMFQCASAQTTYIVGDSLGWTIPPNGEAAYTTWASDKQFMVGDILVFNFATNNHDVQQVQRDSFDACTSTNTIGNQITTGPANITLTSSGENYYICTFGTHCLAGQKLSINVSGTPSTVTPPPPSAPSPTTSNTSPEDACPPTDSPTVSTTPGAVNSPPDSSSPAVFASFFVIFLGIAMSTFV